MSTQIQWANLTDTLHLTVRMTAAEAVEMPSLPPAAVFLKTTLTSHVANIYKLAVVLSVVQHITKRKVELKVAPYGFL